MSHQATPLDIVLEEVRDQCTYLENNQHHGEFPRAALLVLGRILDLFRQAANLVTQHLADQNIRPTGTVKLFPDTEPAISAEELQEARAAQERRRARGVTD